jgi:hypothetical protein
MTKKDDKKGKPLFIQHLDSFPPKPAREFLLELGVSEQLVKTLFDENGEWKYRIEKKINPFTFQPLELQEELVKNLKPIYDVVNYSLDSIYEFGFAKHDIYHINDVTDQVRKLLDLAGADYKTKIIGVTAAVIHDLGNILSRSYHSRLSPMLFKLTFPNFDVDVKSWFRIKKAVVYHDEPVIFEKIDSWGEIDPLKKIEYFRRKFGPEVLALLISDKTRVNRKRLSEKNQTMKAIDEVEHYELNLLGDTEEIRVSKNYALVKFRYNPYATEEEAKMFPGFFKKSKHFGFRAGVSKEAIELHKITTPIDNFSIWRHKFWKIYSEKTFLAIYSLFALFPFIRRVRIQMTDYIFPSSNSFEKVEYCVYPEELKEFERFIRLKYFKKEENKK